MAQIAYVYAVLSVIRTQNVMFIEKVQPRIALSNLEMEGRAKDVGEARSKKPWGIKTCLVPYLIGD